MRDREPLPIWAGLTPEEHEFQYNPQKAFPDFGRYRLYREPANSAAAQMHRHADVAYDEHPLRKLDIYPAKSVAGRATPVHLYLHGGYWRAQDKENFAFVAGALVPLGVTTVIVNYELCPASTLDGVVDSALAAVAWVHRNIAEFGGDPGHITLSGHSAGAHLGAAIIARDWRRDGVADCFVKGATLISGLYDPAPAILTSVNAELNLTPEIAARHNFEAQAPRMHCAVAIIAGGLEPWQWIDQSFRYYHHLRRNGLDPAVHVLPGRNHFDILDEYLTSESTIMQAIRSHIAASPAAAPKLQP